MSDGSAACAAVDGVFGVVDILDTFADIVLSDAPSTSDEVGDSLFNDGTICGRLSRLLSVARFVGGAGGVGADGLSVDVICHTIQNRAFIHGRIFDAL